MAKNETIRPFSILTVCTGNICRSPAMERLLVHSLPAGTVIQVHGAGVMAHEGEQMTELMRRRVRAFGADASGTQARQITERMVAESDLVLTATSQHVRQVLSWAPEAQEQVFLMTHFADLAESLTADDINEARAEVDPATSADTFTIALRALVIAAERARQEQANNGQGGEAGHGDIVDPYMRGEDAYDLAFSQILQPVKKISARIRKLQAK